MTREEAHHLVNKEWLDLAKGCLAFVLAIALAGLISLIVGYWTNQSIAVLTFMFTCPIGLIIFMTIVTWRRQHRAVDRIYSN